MDHIVVLKFGGSVLKNKSSLEGVFSIIKQRLEEGLSVVVVVSAMKGVTDKLLLLAEQMKDELDPSLIDEFLSLGERAVARKLSAYLCNMGLKSIAIEPNSRYWPIISDSNHGNADPILNKTLISIKKKLVPLIKAGYVPVVCGFLGLSSRKEVTTLGRGGSDTTAVLIGSALKAEVVLVKDVDGFYSSDPNKIKEPIQVQSLDANEAQMLAFSGSKLIHSKAFEYLGDSTVKIVGIEKFDKGTLIQGKIPDLSAEIENTKVCMSTVVLGSNASSHVVNKILDLFNSIGCSVFSFFEFGNIVVIFSSDSQNLRQGLHDKLVKEGLAKAVATKDGVAAITVRGKRVGTDKKSMLKILSNVDLKNLEILGLSICGNIARIYVDPQAARKLCSVLGRLN